MTELISRRQAFHRVLGSALGGTPFGASGQAPKQANRVYRVAVLRPTTPPQSFDPFTAEAVLPQAFARMGYRDGVNLQLVFRYADGDPRRLPSLARELVDQSVDVIVTVSPSSVRAAMEATQTIPIVFFGNFDPVAAGFVQSLSRPGRNVTGVLIAPEGTLAAKKLELVKAAVPSAKRIAVLASDNPASSQLHLPEMQQAAARLGLDLSWINVRNGDIGDAFKRIAATGADALFVIAETYFMLNRKPVIAQALQLRLASMWEWREQVQDGGLMSYGTSNVSRWEQAAACVDRILKGARPSETPVDQPTNLGLALNLATAKAIGLEIPQAMLLRAEEIFR